MMVDHMTVTLGEGTTPLVASVQIGRELGIAELYFKLESTNPSGSYKDRFVAAEMKHVLGAGARAAIATSSGNTGSALAAYCARYGVGCFLVVNELAPAGKLVQMKAHGAHILRVPGFGGDPGITAQVFDSLEHLSASHGIPLVVSAYRYSPRGMAGVESLGAELRGRASEVFVPVGGGGLFTAVCRGLAGTGARVHAVQPAGCSTVVAAWQRGDDKIIPVVSTTRISGLAVPFDIDASLALRHLRESGGLGIAVNDEAVYHAQRRLLSGEGIFAEPAGATALAGLYALIRQGWQPAGAVVCLVTGTGFKDLESIQSAAEHAPAERIVDHTETTTVLLAQLKKV
jgi:threonine synthase